MDTNAFESYRALLHGIAYRMLGSISEAEDIVQETYLRYATKSNDDEIQNLRSWLVTVCSRLSLDRLKSAQRQRETYIGPWLPEPLLQTEKSPADELAIDDSVSTALLYTLERLSAAERAAFLLHDIFGYSFDEIAGILDKTPQSCRKLASRARAQAVKAKPRFEVTPQTHRKLIDSFFTAIREGNLASLENILTENVTLISDGGGKAFAARKILHGIPLIGKFYTNITKQAAASGNHYRFEQTWYNGTPGLIIYENDIPITAINLFVSENRIHSFYVHRNPDKLNIFRID